MSGGRGSSNMWEKYFVKQSNDLSKCTLCDKSISTKGRTTKGLSVHLKSIHKIDPKESSQNLEAASSQSSSGPPEALASGSGSVNESMNGMFSLTFDEWTSKKNKRYMNINLHFKNEHRNLGLIRINTSASAENLVRLISERLNLFNLNLENDIISITTDGPNVMKKLGRIVPCLQQFCYAFGKL